ncbi:DMT family transporter [Labrys wisconsinensis]|uniref:Transporter family-2 protein n=1 Tax=Labrys wisconsinensis TaxID=425677 RepID=A0ABU0JJ12_9HYPH|nr:DMT family transporter [Labrys wisconsinensis]MDQ0474275.1 transporter family-2 protein [Labrys wisconsinensis]
MPNAGPLSLLAAALLAGAVVPFQAGANAALGRLLGHPLWAALVSLGVSVAVIIPVMVAFRIPTPTLAETLKGPWWIWIGGAAGVLYITAALLLAPRLGAAGFIVAVIAGQMLVSAAIDHFGLMGFPEKPVGAARLAGIGLIVGGVVLVQLAGTPAAQAR